MTEQTTAPVDVDRAEILADLNAARAENTRLRAQLAELGAERKPAELKTSFELSAGEAADLQLNGVTRQALSGKALIAEDFPEYVNLSALSEQALKNIAAEKKRRG